MLTLDELKEKIKRIDEIHTNLKELHDCPDPFTKPHAKLIYSDGGLEPKQFLSYSILKKVISVGIQHLQRELFNELTTLMGEIQCTNTTSVECQLP